MDKEFSSLEEIFDHFFPDQQCHSSQWCWDKSSAEKLIWKTVHFSEDGFCVQFHPLFSYGTAAVWGECALDELVRAYWEVAVDELYGSSMMFGVGTRDALQSVPFGFVDIIGGVGQLGDQAYGLSHKGFTSHACETRPFCAQLRPSDRRGTCTVGILFDGPSARIGFALDGNWLGWAFQAVKLAGRVYYPMVSSTAQRSFFTLLPHQQRQTRTPKALAHKCMDTIVDQLLRVRRTQLPSLGKLGLPKGLECELWQWWCMRVMLYDKKATAAANEREASTPPTQTEEHPADHSNSLLLHSNLCCSSRKRKSSEQQQANKSNSSRRRSANDNGTAQLALAECQAANAFKQNSGQNSNNNKT